MGIFSHWYVLLGILALVLIVYGPGKLPEVGAAVGKAMREFRKASTDLQDDFKRSTSDPPVDSRPADTRPSPDPAATDVKSPTDKAS